VLGGRERKLKTPAFLERLIKPNLQTFQYYRVCNFEYFTYDFFNFTFTNSMIKCRINYIDNLTSLTQKTWLHPDEIKLYKNVPSINDYLNDFILRIEVCISGKIHI
jgi:hypothetical protein